MNLEDEILGIEKRAAEIVSSARHEAKKLLGTFEEARARVRADVTARLERELAGLRGERTEKLRGELDEVRRWKERMLESVEGIGSASVKRCADEILAALLEDKGNGH